MATRSPVVRVSWMRPRRPARSPLISPMAALGASMLTVTSGSSTRGLALATASRNALRPAITKAISFESTGWVLPS